MNTKDFVTYEQALTLKKLGFNEETIKYYLIDNDQIQPSSKSLIFGIHVEIIHNFNESSTNVVSAPTLTQVKNWLLREKRINVEAIFNGSLMEISEYSWNVRWNDLNKNTNDSLEERFDFPEEALSAGITECLKLLEE